MAQDCSREYGCLLYTSRCVEETDREDVYTGTVENIPEETCVTIRFCGSHKDAGKYYVKLCDFIAEKHMRIANFSKEITMIDYGMTNDTDKFVTEIQIPVQAM